MAASFFGAAVVRRRRLRRKKFKPVPEKILVAYYSWGGNTRFAAEKIREITGGTLFEIRPVKAYPSNYRACVEQARKECREGRVLRWRQRWKILKV